MDTSDNDEFCNRIVALGEIFNAQLSPQKQALYFEALRDLPFPAVAQALNDAARTCTWFPKPAEIRTLALGDAEDATEAAWMQFQAAMRAVGGYSSLVVRDTALADTITAVFQSWPAACDLDLSPEMWAAKRKEFGRVYRVVRQRGQVGGRYLFGIHERHNAGRSEWMQYTPVAELNRAGEVCPLSLEEAEAARTQLAAVHGGLRQLASEIPSLPEAVEDEA